MSHEAVSWALYDAPTLTTDAGRPDSTARYILVVLAEKADPYGANSYPSTLTIQFVTGLDQRTIQRALRRLEHGELIARDGVSRYGTTRWKLAMPRTRPESEWAELQAEAETARRAEGTARQARRYRAKHAQDEPMLTDADVSGTETPGHPVDNPVDNSSVQDADSRTHRHPTGPGTLPTESVRDADSRRPARKVPDVRDAAPPEPPREPPLTTPGGTLPPDPLRHEAPTGLRNEQDHSLSTAADQRGDQHGDHRPRAREQLRLIAGNPDAATTTERGIWPTPVPTTNPSGHGFCLPCHTNGQVTLAADPTNGSACAYHLRTNTA